MPIYEYKCLDCDTHIEKMQKISDAPLAICEKCGGRMEKQISLSGFQFKGAGWYVTDYAKKSGGAAGSAGKSDKADGAEKSEKSDKSEGSEKTSQLESTAKTESASNSASDTKTQAKVEKTSKKE